MQGGNGVRQADSVTTCKPTQVAIRSRCRGLLESTADP